MSKKVKKKKNSINHNKKLDKKKSNNKKNLIVSAIGALMLISMIIFSIVSYLQEQQKQRDLEMEIREQRMEELSETGELEGINLEDDIDIEELLSDDVIPIGKGNKYFDFKTKTITDNDFSLSEIKGKKILLNFWATWCPPCREEMPDLQRISSEFDDVEVIAVNLTDQDSIENIKDFIDEYNFDFTIPLDKSGDIAKMYNIIAIPTTYTIDSNGKVNNTVLGEMNYDMMVEEINQLD